MKNDLDKKGGVHPQQGCREKQDGQRKIPHVQGVLHGLYHKKAAAGADEQEQNEAEKVPAARFFAFSVWVHFFFPFNFIPSIIIARPGKCKFFAYK